MKTTGIVLIVLGGLSTLGALIAALRGASTSFGGGLILAVVGAFLVSQANKKKEEEEKKKKWAEDNADGK
jgi:hypothetical protein